MPTLCSRRAWPAAARVSSTCPAIQATACPVRGPWHQLLLLRPRAGQRHALQSALSLCWERGKAEAPHTVSGRLLERVQAVTCSLVSEVTPWHRALRDTAMASGTSNIAKAACRMPGYRPPVHLEQVPRKSWGSGKASASKRWYHLNRELYPSAPRDSYLCQGGSVAALAP